MNWTKPAHILNSSSRSNMKTLIKIVVILILAGAYFVTGPGRKSSLAGTWRARIVQRGIEINAQIDLQPSGDIVLNASGTPLDPSLVVMGRQTADGLPARTLTFSARGKWNVVFNTLRTSFKQSNFPDVISPDEVFGGKIISVDSNKFVYRAPKERGSSETVEETWYR
jgi:hypothetical protein